MLASRRPDELTIARLTMRGIDVGARLHLADALRQADWPRPSGDEWVFVRNLGVRAPASVLPARIAAALRDTLGCSADDSRVVRYASEEDMVAALLVDLIDGRAGERWVWRRWAALTRLPVAEAIGRLLREHLVRLAALSVRLATRGGLAAVWQALHYSDAIDLGQRLAAHYRYRLPVPGKGDGRDRAVVSARPGPVSLLHGGSLPVAVSARWRGVLEDLDEWDPRRRLALQLIAGEIMPMALIRAPAETLGCLSACFRRDGAPDPSPTTMPAGGIAAPFGSIGDRQDTAARPGSGVDPGQRAGAGLDDRGRPGRARTDPSGTPAPKRGDAGSHGVDDGRSAAGDGDVGSRRGMLAGPDARVASMSALRNGPRQPGALPRSGTTPAQRADRRREDDAVAGVDAGATTDRSDATPTRRTAPASAARIAVDPAAGVGTAHDRFATAQAGLFRLLNMLNRPEAQALMRRHWAVLPNGWAWLYRLGQALSLDEQDPVTAFIADQIGLADPGSLADLPPLPARAGLLALATAWYGRSGLWQPALLALDARVDHTASHVDIHAPLDSVRLDVRLAGLDLDPGWLPWLGRVVRFHFE